MIYKDFNCVCQHPPPPSPPLRRIIPLYKVLFHPFLYKNRATMKISGSGHYSDSPLLRRPIIPTAYFSERLTLIFILIGRLY